VYGQQVQDLLTFNQLQKAHGDKAFVRIAVADAKFKDGRSLRDIGWRPVALQLEGGSRVTLKTPYIAEKTQDSSGKRQYKQKFRGKGGTGVYPVLVALGLLEHATPLVRREAAREMVRAQSYKEAASTLALRGLDVDVKTLTGWALSVGSDAIEMRDERLRVAKKAPVPSDGAFAGKRLLISEDGGRAQLRFDKKVGRPRKSGRRGYTTEWKEPKGFVIYVLDEEGELDRDFLPLYDMTMGDADAILELLVGYLRLHGAAYAKEILVVADAADWIWNRVPELIKRAELKRERVFELIDFYHASEYLTKAVELCRYLSKVQKEELHEKLRGHLAQQRQPALLGLLKPYVEPRTKDPISGKQGPKDPMQGIIDYFESHKDWLRYRDARRRKLPIGSGAMESAVMRVVNMRFKGPGLSWRPENIERLLHLRAQLKAGRFDEMYLHLLRHNQPLLSEESDVASRAAS